MGVSTTGGPFVTATLAWEATASWPLLYDRTFFTPLFVEVPRIIVKFGDAWRIACYLSYRLRQSTPRGASIISLAVTARIPPRGSQELSVICPRGAAVATSRRGSSRSKHTC